MHAFHGIRSGNEFNVGAVYGAHMFKHDISLSLATSVIEYPSLWPSVYFKKFTHPDYNCIQVNYKECCAKHVGSFKQADINLLSQSPVQSA